MRPLSEIRKSIAENADVIDQEVQTPEFEQAARRAQKRMEISTILRKKGDTPVPVPRDRHSK